MKLFQPNHILSTVMKNVISLTLQFDLNSLPHYSLSTEKRKRKRKQKVPEATGDK